MKLLVGKIIEYMRVLEEGQKSFAQLSRDPIAQAQAEIFFSLGIRNPDLMKFGIKQAERIKKQYQEKCLDVIRNFQRGRLDSEKAYRLWRSATKEALEKMYRAGGAIVGNPFYKDLPFPVRDKRLMVRYLNREGQFWKKFLRDIKSPTHRPVFPYEQRALFYADSLEAMKYNGMLFGSGEDVEIHWVLGVPMTCFSNPDLPIVTKDGVKKIKDIKEGELVKTHTGEFRRVRRTAKFPAILHEEYNNDKEQFLVRLVIMKDNGEEVELECSPNHRILTNKGWVRADELTEDMEILEDKEENRTAKLIKKEFIKKNYDKDKFVLLYDLEVEKDESYIANGIIVHNSHCSDCEVLAQTIWTPKTLPTVPRAGDTQCIVSGRIGIYTSKGLKRVSRIKPGDLVLTHKGRFRKVVATQKTPYTEEALQFDISVGVEKVRLIVSKDHKFMVGNGVWKKAKDFKSGEKISIIAQKCPQCERTFYLVSDYFKECCSKECSNKYWGERHVQKIHNKSCIYIENEAVVKNIKALKGRKRFRYDLEVEEDHSYLTRVFVSLLLPPGN